MMTTRKTLVVLIAVAVLAALGRTVQAAMILPVTGTASSTTNPLSNSYGHPDRAVDGSGMDPARTLHDNTNWPSHWIGANGDVVNAWYKVDLGGSYWLEEMRVWNCNDSYINTYLRRCITQGDVYVSNEVAPGAIPTNNASGNGWTLVTANYSFALANGLPNLPYTDSFDLTGHQGRFVAINVDANGGVDNWNQRIASLAEVQVFEGGPPGADDIPEPATCVLMGLALAGLGRTIRRRTGRA